MVRKATDTGSRGSAILTYYRRRSEEKQQKKEAGHHTLYIVTRETNTVQKGTTAVLLFEEIVRSAKHGQNAVKHGQKGPKHGQIVQIKSRKMVK